jgi:hypothetical protein
MAKGGKNKKPVKNTKKPKKLKAFDKSDRDPDSTLNTPDVEYRYGPGKTGLEKTRLEKTRLDLINVQGEFQSQQHLM